MVSAMTAEGIEPRPAPDYSATAAGGESAERAAGGRRLHVVERVAAHHDLVAVGQRRPLDAPPVHVHAVERPVVEDPHAVGLGDDQRMAPRDGRVVEADVGGQRAADPRPFARYRHDDAPAASLRRRGTCPGTDRFARASSIQSGRVGATGSVAEVRGTVPSPATGSVPVASISPGVRGSIYVSPLARVARALPATLPPSGIVGRGSMGPLTSLPDGEALARPASKHDGPCRRSASAAPRRPTARRWSSCCCAAAWASRRPTGTGASTATARR